MKKLTISLILSLVMALTLGLTACTEGGSDKRNKFNELITTESVYGFSAASAGMLISAAGNVGNAKTSDVKTHSAAAAESSETSGNDDAVVPGCDGCSGRRQNFCRCYSGGRAELKR